MNFLPITTFLSDSYAMWIFVPIVTFLTVMRCEFFLPIFTFLTDMRYEFFILPVFTFLTYLRCEIFTYLCAFFFFFFFLMCKTHFSGFIGGICGPKEKKEVRAQGDRRQVPQLAPLRVSPGREEQPVQQQQQQ